MTDDVHAQRAERRRTRALLLAVLREQRRGLAVGVAVGLVYTAGKVAVPQLTRLAIDRGIARNGSLWWWSGLIVAAGVVTGVFTALRRWYAFRESRWTETRLRERLFDHILSLHIGFHDRAQTGQLMSRASSDLNQIQILVVMVPLTLSNLALIATVVVVLFLTDPVLAVIALAPLPLINVAANRFSRRIHPAVVAVQAEQAELATVVEETVAGVRVVKGFGAEPVRAARLRTEADDIRTVSMGAARVRATFMPLIELLPTLALIAVLGVGGHRVLDGHLTIGELVAFNASLALLVWPLRMMGMTIAFAQRAMVAIGRIDEVLSTVPEVGNPATPVDLAPPDSSGAGTIAFHDVTFGYQPGAPVLTGVDLTVPAGSSVALVGGTGSGKSTVARLLLRFYDAQSGTITLDGIDLRQLRVHDLRRAIGVVFEDTLLFNDSVAANIAFADPDAGADQVERAARLAGADAFIRALSDGYATVIGERGYSLSGGQRQRIAIARVILADPRVLVLDDATSAVDPSKEHEIRSAMSTVMTGRTTIVIAHRPATIALADTVVLLDGGRVVETGTHDELLATTSRYREVLAAMADERSDVDGDASAVEREPVATGGD